MNPAFVQRRRFATGLVLALVAGVGLLYLLLDQARANEHRYRSDRYYIVTLRALAEAIERAGGSGEEARSLVEETARQHSKIQVIRVVKGVRLEASTSPEDTGENAAPRRLVRAEKPLFDLGQRLRAAVQTNREEGSARKEEIEITSTSSGGLSLATPIEQDGSVVGYVQTVTAPLEAAPGASWLPLLLAVVVPSILFLVLCFLIGENRAVLAVAAFALLIAAIGTYGWFGIERMRTDRKGTEAALAARIKQEAQRGTAILGSRGIDMSKPFRLDQWDSDIYRRPRGTISSAGEPIPEKIEAQIQQQTAQIKKVVIAALIFSSLLLAFVGFGVASNLIQTIVEYRQAYTYTLPAMIGMVVLVFFPFLYGIALSFTGSNLYTINEPMWEIWVGLRNYVEVLGDFAIARQTQEGWIFNYSNFYWTFLFTIVWTVTNVTIGVTLGLILALILNTKGLALRPIYRVLLIFPWAMPNYITALIWKGMFHQQFGVINQVIMMGGGQSISWFEQPHTSFFTALATNGWLSFPFMMVVSLGALQSIPSDLYEAARVDGATRWQQFRSITLPSLKPALVPAVILSVVWTFNMFNIIYLVTAGEPAGSTEILITQAYKIAFEKYRYGYAAAYSTVIFLILLAYGSIQNRATRATEAIT